VERHVAQAEGLQLVEEHAGWGSLEAAGQVIGRVQYEIQRFQGFARSGLPVPGVHRVAGSVNLEGISERHALVGTDLTLRLENGRALRIALADAEGRVLTEGHGPSRCSCC
jgi:hypothetical protein